MGTDDLKKNAEHHTIKSGEYTLGTIFQVLWSLCADLFEEQSEVYVDDYPAE